MATRSIQPISGVCSALAMVTALALSPAAGAVELATSGRVDVIEAVTVAETTELDFGTVVDRNGTITLGLPSTITGDANDIHVGGTTKAGVYTLSGGANLTVSVSFSGSTANGLTIDQFETDQADLSSVSLGPEGAVALAVGADLTVAQASAAPGADQALSFVITVAYN